MEAERQVIGALFLSPALTDDVMGVVNSGDFFYRPYGWMFNAICEMKMADLPVTQQSVIRKLGETRNSEGKTYLEEMDGSRMVLASVEGVMPEDCFFWAERVKKKRQERDLLAYGDWVRKQAMSNPADIRELQFKVEERLLNVTASETTKSEVLSGHDRMDELEARINRYIDDPDAITGMAVDWPVFDRLLDGLQPGNVTIVYAPTSRYKSFVVTNMGWRLARNGHAGLWYTTEMPVLQVRERVVQLVAGLNFKWERRRNTLWQHRDEIRSALREVATYPIYYNDKSEVEIGNMRATVMRQKKWNNIEYVIVDLVDHVNSTQDGENETSNMSRIMRKMKDIAKAADVHIILVSHVSKTDAELKRMPVLEVSAMKGSSSKSQDVDNAISVMPVLWDEGSSRWIGMTRQEISNTVADSGILTLLLAVTKSRHGELGEVPFAINMHYGGRMAPMVGPVWTKNGLFTPEEKESPPEEEEKADDVLAA